MALAPTLVCAAPVSATDAANAARAFARRHPALTGRRTSAPAVRHIRRHAFTNDTAVFSVSLKGGGTLFLSGDDADEPVVAFTSATNDFASLDTATPLGALLARDATVRANIRRAAAARPARTRWRALTSTPPAATALVTDAGDSSSADVTNRLTEIDDVRVAPLLKTRWSQSSSQGHYCYNAFTPNNWYCGCTATAMAQTMRYFAWPKTAVEQKTFTCSVSGWGRNLTLWGGPYAWDLMPDAPDEATYSQEAWEAIGHLTSDAGIALGSSYASNGTGAYVATVAEQLTETFGYANAVCCEYLDSYYRAYMGDGYVHAPLGLHDRSVRQRTLGANLDAGLPVVMGIYGYQGQHVGDSDYFVGHSVVGDGYGYCTVGDDAVPYVHVNLGWAGADDAWYNLPEIHTAETGAYASDSDSSFTIFESCVCNIFTNTTGEIVSGRVLDDAGNPVSDARVTAADGAYETRTNEKGIYALILPSETTAVLVAETNGTTAARASVTLGTTADGTVGNRWGVDLILGRMARLEPTVLYVAADGDDATGTGAAEHPFATIAAALADAIDGDEIRVGPGTYPGPVVAPAARVTIVATSGFGATTIDGGGTNRCYLGTGNAASVLTGFHLVNGYAEVGAGAYGGVLSNCVVTGCHATWYGGGAAEATLVRCTVYGNEADVSGGGVASDCICRDSILWGNVDYGDDGAKRDSNWETLYGVDDYGYREECGQTVGDHVCTTPELGDDCIMDDPCFVDASRGDLRLRFDSPCVGAASDGANIGAWQEGGVAGALVTASAVGFGTVEPTYVFFESGTPITAVTFTATSEYHPFAGFETNGVAVASSGRTFSWTVPEAGGELVAYFLPTNFCVDAASGDDGNDGLSWTSARRTLASALWDTDVGDEVRVAPGVYAPPRVYSTEVRVVSTQGAAVTAIDGAGAEPCLDGYEMTYVGFTIRGGYAPGQYGGGAYDGTYVDCVFSNNTSSAGGGVACATLTNCLVVGNSSTRYGHDGGIGGGVYDSSLYNCTVVGNAAQDTGGGVYQLGCEAVNTIVSGNAAYGWGRHVADLDYEGSVVTACYTGGDPKFVDAAVGNYVLAVGSPCVNAGENAYVVATNDLAGGTRIVGETVDIGCYEQNVAPAGWTGTVPVIPAGATDAQVTEAVTNALAADGYEASVTECVTNVPLYEAFTAWPAARGIAAGSHAAMPLAVLSSAIWSLAEEPLAATNLNVVSVEPGTGADWTLTIDLGEFDLSRVSSALLKEALGVKGSREPNGEYSADELSLEITPREGAVELRVTPPEDAETYFMRATGR